MHVASEAEYPEAHVEGCDRNCARYYPDSEEVLKALSSNRLPLVFATPSARNPSQYTFEIISYELNSNNYSMPYVAYSHVWIDGLGSTTEQGIPSCEANYLARTAASQISPDGHGVAFWIDSLCVPAASGARKKAIELMSATYQRADTVLVLDDTLRKVALHDDSGNKSSPEYLLFRIYTSPWSQRVWTYQEGALAQKLVFAIAGGQSIVLDFPLDLDGGPTRGPLSIALGRDMLHHIYSYLRAEVQALNGQVNPINLGTVALELRWRDTLHRNPNGRNDEILAVGTVLGLDMQKLLNEPEGMAQMVLFYKLVGRLYRNIIFADVSRLQADGFRWAPSTFLVKDERRPATNLERQGVDCTQNGLVGSYITFAVADGEVVQYDNTRRVTVVTEQTSFDIVVPSEQLFSFTHIIIYPMTMPESIRGTIFVAAAVLEDLEYTRTHHASDRTDFVGTFQTLIYLSWLREWETPVKLDRFPNGEQLVIGSMQELKVLLR
jgi:hypothetical protein